MIDKMSFIDLLKTCPLSAQGSNRGYDPVQLIVQFRRLDVVSHQILLPGKVDVNGVVFHRELLELADKGPVPGHIFPSKSGHEVSISYP